MVNLKRNENQVILILIAFGIFLSILRIEFAERGIDTKGFQAIADSLFALGLWGMTWIISIGAGRFIFLKLNRNSDFSFLEKLITYSGLGFGIISIGIAFLGFAGLLNAVFIYFWLFICLIMWKAKRLDFPALRFPKELAYRGILLACGATIILTTIQALSPPWDYDGLMYHLEGTRRFLEAGRIYYLSDIWQANGPFLTEMLFTIGMSQNSDTFPKLINLTFAILYFIATFTFAKRFINITTAWISLSITLGIAILPIWASWAYTDFSWAYYDFMAVFFICIWSTEITDRRPLVFAGFFSGFAFGTKYLAINGAFLLSLWIIIESSRLTIPNIFTNLASYLTISLILGCPWWIKNWLLIGNPIFPFFFPTKEWNSSRITLLMGYLRSFGIHQNFMQYITLPISIYMFHPRFGTFSQEIPSLLYPISLIYAFIRNNRILNRLGLYTLGMFTLWAFGSQQVRFLLPIFPCLSVLTAHVLASIPSPKIRRIVLASLVGGLILTTLIYQGIYFQKQQVEKVIIGSESKAEFLRRSVVDYKAMEHIKTTLPAESKILNLWDGQSYYCRNCIPDTDQNAWLNYTLDSPPVSEIASRLESKGITHILFSGGDIAWFIKHHNTFGQIDKALSSLRDFIEICGKEVYNDGASIIYEVYCQ